MRKALFAPIITLFMLASTVIALGSSAPTAMAASRDCDNNAIVNCGALTASELQSKYNANSTGDLDNVYAHYGITSSMISAAGSAKIGTVTKDGKVIVGGKTVATGAQSVGRQNISGSTAVTIGGKTYYQRPTSVSFVSNSLSAFVFFDANGQYTGAIIQSCGNPVKATPVPVPPKPQPPKPTPVATCVNVTATKISRDTYAFTGKASVSGGATVKSYVFTITHSSGTAKVITVTSGALTAASGNVKLEDGTHTVKLLVKTSVGDKTSTACTTQVTVTPLPPNKVEVCNPATGETIFVDEKDQSKYKPVGDIACTPVEVCNPTTGETMTVKRSEEHNFKPVGDEACKVKGETVEVLPSTGPTELIGGGLGLTSLTAAGYYWRASRRQLIGTLLNK